MDVYGEYYRGGSTTGGWEIKAKGGSRHKQHTRAAARPIATIPGLQDIQLQGGKKPKKPRTTQARPISAKPLTREEILLDNLQKELVRAETQQFLPHIIPHTPTIIPFAEVEAYLKSPEHIQNKMYKKIAKDQKEAYEKKKTSRLLADKLAREHGTYYYEMPKSEKDLLEHLKTFYSK